MSENELIKNGWQNSGWFLNKAESENLNIYEYRIYLSIVRYSVGYGDPYTKAMTQKQWSEKIGVSNKTFNKTIASLIDKKMIQKIGHFGKLKGGGSTPYMYGPIFPKDFNIWLKKKSDNNIEQKEEYDFHGY